MIDKREVTTISQSKIVKNTIKNGSEKYDENSLPLNYYTKMDYGRELYEITRLFVVSYGRVIYRYRQYNFDDNYSRVKFLVHKYALTKNEELSDKLFYKNTQGFFWRNFNWLINKEETNMRKLFNINKTEIREVLTDFP